ncbi:MAG: DNA polymerase III subunit delta [Bifidobacteriaceae bacterium]|jgi:DNA polymerase-3 subunit delta|nr:DNA polymerase III subunit delta [Bifidobacteriaceae bacterium]
MPPRAKSSAHVVGWDQVTPAPIVLVSGKEELLAERAMARVVRLARRQTPDAEVTELDASASAYGPGSLAAAAGPSLFADAGIVVARGVSDAGDEFAVDILAYVAAPEPAATVVLRHAGGLRGKKVLDAVRAAGYPEVVCAELTRDADKMAFASAELRRHERTITSDALRALMDAVGSDLRELAASVDQLVEDTEGRITRDDVDKYYGGRVEATGFKVADAAIAGDAGGALTLARHAMATGTDPVLIVAALAAKLRTLAKVGGARRRGLDPVKDLGVIPWQVDRAKRDLRAWSAHGLGAAIQAVARADAEVKGAGRDPRYAVERAILTVAAATSPGRPGPAA